MSNAPRDANFVPAKSAAVSTTGKSVQPIEANPTNHALSVDDGTTGTDNGPTNALRDGNNVPTLMAVSSADGVTPVTLYANTSGHLLIQTT